MSESPQTLGLYVSVPFCRAKCSFCNFASGVGSAGAVERYLELLLGEIRGSRRAAAEKGIELPGVVDTVYFGGGTPSSMEPEQMAAIFRVLRGEFAIADHAEITMEAAPGQIGDTLLARAMDCGVNRVSLGVQSFVDREAQAVGRSHTGDSCVAEIRRLHAAGLANVGADLIVGLPYQTKGSWEQSLEIASSCGLEHLSVYMLEVDEESRLGREVLGGGARLHAPAVPSDDLTADLYERACERLSLAGFAQYEISNFATAGRCSQHNLKYWQRQPYLGFGLDAHSMLTTPEGEVLRWANADELSAYDGGSKLRAADRCSEREVFEEIVFLGLRLNEGLRQEQLRGFPRDWITEFADGAQLLAGEGLMEIETGGWRLTRRGRLVSSAVFGELLATVAA
ncbi:MAG: radical SAM family heme chaperone HemW [Janthinobacterium lividum]